MWNCCNAAEWAAGAKKPQGEMPCATKRPAAFEMALALFGLFFCAAVGATLKIGVYSFADAAYQVKFRAALAMKQCYCDLHSYEFILGTTTTVSDRYRAILL